MIQTNIMETIKTGRDTLQLLDDSTNSMNSLDVNKLPIEWRVAFANYVDLSKDLADCFVAMAFNVSRLLEDQNNSDRNNLSH
jgi:hypothetical protein